MGLGHGVPASKPNANRGACLDPPPGSYFAVLPAEKVGAFRVNVSIYAHTPEIYEVGVHIPSLRFSGDGTLTVDFAWDSPAVIRS